MDKLLRAEVDRPTNTASSRETKFGSEEMRVWSSLNEKRRIPAGKCRRLLGVDDGSIPSPRWLVIEEEESSRELRRALVEESTRGFLLPLSTMEKYNRNPK